MVTQYIDVVIVKHFMELMGYTEEVMAEKMNVSPSLFKKFINGGSQQRILAGWIFLIAEILRVSPLSIMHLYILDKNKK